MVNFITRGIIRADMGMIKKQGNERRIPEKQVI